MLSRRTLSPPDLGYHWNLDAGSSDSHDDASTGAVAGWLAAVTTDLKRRVGTMLEAMTSDIRDATCGLNKNPREPVVGISGRPFIAVRKRAGDMLGSIKSFFRSSMRPPPENEPAAANKDPRIAACALLLEVAQADAESTDDLRQHLQSTVRSQFGLGEAGAQELLNLAEEARAAAVGLWQFTNLIGEIYSTDRKMVLVEIMRGLVYLDGVVTANEDYVMRKVFSLLRLDNLVWTHF